MLRAVTVEKLDLLTTSKFKKHPPFPAELSWLETIWVAILH